MRAEGANLCRKLASASYANFDTLFLGVPKRVPKITALNRIQAYFPGPLKKSTFLKNPLSASGYAPVASESVVALSFRVALRRRSRAPSVV